MRWSVTPEGTSIIGYECELDDSGMTPSGPDGECELLEPSLDNLVVSVGGPSLDCGGTGNPVDHCTDHEISDGLGIEPVDYNLWSVTFADTQVNPGAESFDPAEIYLLQETDNLNLTGTTSAGPWMGNHPVIRFKQNQFNSKFTAAHEYGHLAFFIIPNEQASPPHPLDPLNDLDYDAQGHTLNTHFLNSPEHHAAAAVEGFSDFAAAVTWHDLSDSDIIYVRLNEAGSGGQARTKGLLSATPPINCIPACAAGQSSELQWGNALRLFLLSTPGPSLGLVAGMLAAVHGSMWYPSGLLFAGEFDHVMDPDGQDYLGDAGLYERWTELVADWEIGT